MATFYALLADAIVVVHAAYVGFVLLGELAIALGGLLRWAWVRNFTFRAVHLLLIGIVVVESLAGITCPLTNWEAGLRIRAGQSVEEATFIGRIVHWLIFCQAPEWAFTLAYCSFGALVAATLYWVPPRWPRRADVE
jgi:hypothetical protein